MTICYLLIAVLLLCGLWLLCGAVFFYDRSFEGRLELRRYAKWQGVKNDIWSNGPLRSLTAFAGRFVYLDTETEEILARRLSRISLKLTPKEYTARRYVILYVLVMFVADQFNNIL